MKESCPNSLKYFFLFLFLFTQISSARRINAGIGLSEGGRRVYAQLLEIRSLSSEERQKIEGMIRELEDEEGSSFVPGYESWISVLEKIVEDSEIDKQRLLSFLPAGVSWAQEHC